MKRLACLTLVMALTAVWNLPAIAQDYKVLSITASDIDPNSRDTNVRLKFSQTRQAVIDYLGNRPLDEEGRALMRKFFRDAYLRNWTQPQNWTSAGANRQEFLRTFYGPLRAQPESRAFLNEIMVEFMSEYIKPAYHPVLRYNAALLLGDLKSREFNQGSQSPEVPYAPATGALLAALEDPQQSDAVKVGAWIGLLKHSELYGVNLGSMAGADKGRVLNLTVATLNAKTPPEGISPEAHQWMRKRAIDVAAAIGNAGRDGALAKALDQVITDDEMPLDMRLSAIAAKGQLAIDQQTAASMDIVKQTADIGKIALEAVGDDLAWYDATLKEFLRNRPQSMYDGGGYSPAPPEPASTRNTSRRNRRSRGSEYDYGYEGSGSESTVQPMEPARDPALVRTENLFRRRVKMHLNDAMIGLVGVVPSRMPEDPSTIRSGLIRFTSDPEEREVVANLAKSMLAMLSVVDNEETQEQALLTSSRSRLETLTTSAQRLAAKAAVEIPEAPESLEESPDDDLPAADVPPGMMPNQPPDNGPPANQPPADVPPSDVPPADVPGSDVPGADVPPADVPGGATPPADQPPADVPPADMPASDAPPADVPPVDPPADAPAEADTP